jgi:hypothetical protein
MVTHPYCTVDEVHTNEPKTIPALPILQLYVTDDYKNKIHHFSTNQPVFQQIFASLLPTS